MSVSHPNVLTSYKMCVVKLMMATEGLEGPPTTNDQPGSSSGSGSDRKSGNSSRLVPSLMGSHAVVELMSSTDVLEPG